jgi:uncharacterized protein (UPF0332 family)
MDFEWTQYIDLAEQLIEYANNSVLKSAYYRSSVSRSYYGVFCIARDKIKEEGFDIRQHDSHNFVIGKFFNNIFFQVGNHKREINSAWRTNINGRI